MQSYRDPAQAIRVSENEVFAIELEGNPTTGYTWVPDLSAGCLELVQHEYQLSGAAMGSAGREVFRLLAREPGVTEIRFAYRRRWGGRPRDIRCFQVVIE